MTITKRNLEVAGWIIFIASAICFTWAGYRAGDILSTTGSLLFLLACFFFLVPVTGKTARQGLGESG